MELAPYVTKVIGKPQMAYSLHTHMLGEHTEQDEAAACKTDSRRAATVQNWSKENHSPLIYTSCAKRATVIHHWKELFQHNKMIPSNLQ